MKTLKDSKIAVIGLGYVGLPLAVEFAKKYSTVGYDINKVRVQDLQKGHDDTLEVNDNDLKERLRDNPIELIEKGGLYISDALTDISECNIYVITVPTPIDQFKAPDLGPLRAASKMLAKLLKKGDVVIYESTTYPGCTEEECVPLLVKGSNMTFNKDFYVGYSPERINPGDKVNTLTKIIKVTSGSTQKAADYIDALYSSIITAGTHKAPNIKVAEASKAIENAQRDVNISFVNELALIFDRIGIDTNDVLAAAGTKWNFLNYKPGLVGGHCISVDPYYLAHKAESLGYHPAVILSGRRVNDNMGMFVANKVVKLMMQKGIKVKGSKVLILGITFKENCPDIRNTKVIDIFKELDQFGLNVGIHDPWANPKEVQAEYNLDIIPNQPELSDYDAVILAVSHEIFRDYKYDSIDLTNTVVFDAKNFLDRTIVDARL
jgi:UDP-N-acetyl-D-galactosamine dehydrogenase